MAPVSPAPARAAPIGSGPPTAKVADPSKTSGSIVAKGVPFRIEPLQEALSWYKGLIYGAHGVGKTELMGSACDVEPMRDVLIISAEGGEDTIKSTSRISDEGKAHVLTIQVHKYDTVAHIHDWLRAHLRARDANDVAQLKQLQAAVTGQTAAEIVEPYRFRTVILDSLTEIESYSVYQVTGINTENIIQDDMEIAGWPEFRKNFESVKLLIRAYRNLNMHVIFSCALTYKQDQTKKMFYQPLLTGQLSRAAQGFVSQVGYLVMDTAKQDQDAPRRLFVQPVQISGAGLFDAKNRYSAYKASFFDNPTMLDIMQGCKLIPS